MKKNICVFVFLVFTIFLKAQDWKEITYDSLLILQMPDGSKTLDTMGIRAYYYNNASGSLQCVINYGMKFTGKYDASSLKEEYKRCEKVSVRKMPGAVSLSKEFVTINGLTGYRLSFNAKINSKDMYVDQVFIILKNTLFTFQYMGLEKDKSKLDVLLSKTQFTVKPQDQLISE